MESNLPKRFQSYVKTHNLISRDDKVLVAVSGGVDSMALLSLLVINGYDVSVAHCNFQLRGEEAYEDEVLVEEEAKKYGISFFNMRFDTAGEMDRTGESVQIAARRLRYDWFRELSHKYGYSVIAIAHHADDSIETFFINMLRGTGLRGLTGISVVNGNIVRPLLFASRKEILDYAVASGIPYREDSSNRSTKYMRNKIRLGIIPRLKEIKPNFPEIMGATINRLTDAQIFIAQSIENIRERAESHRDGLIIIDPSRIDEDYPQGFVIYELLVKYGFKGEVVDDLCDSLDKGTTGKRFYSRDYVAYTDRSKVIVAPIASEDTCDVVIYKNTTKAFCGNSVFYFEFTDIDNIKGFNQPENVALLDADKLEYPLLSRRWKDGDWFIPLGMSGRKKVSDYLVDAKISMAEKQRQFVLLSGEDIVWLAGRRIDERYKITSSTENILKIVRTPEKKAKHRGLI